MELKQSGSMISAQNKHAWATKCCHTLNRSRLGLRASPPLQGHANYVGDIVFDLSDLYDLHSNEIIQ